MVLTVLAGHTAAKCEIRLMRQKDKLDREIQRMQRTSAEHDPATRMWRNDLARQFTLWRDYAQP